MHYVLLYLFCARVDVCRFIPTVKTFASALVTAWENTLAAIFTAPAVWVLATGHADLMFAHWDDFEHLELAFSTRLVAFLFAGVSSIAYYFFAFFLAPVRQIKEVQYRLK